MAVCVTETFSGFFQSDRPPYRGRRQFEVTGTPWPLTAVDATGQVDREGKPCRVLQRGDRFLDSSTLLCVGPEIAEVRGPDHYVVNCDCEVNVLTAAELDPLQQPARFRWETVELVEPVDTDLDGLPIQNAAGSLFPPPGRVVTMKRLYVTKWRPAPYDVALAESYENTTNQAALTLGGVPVRAQHLRCCSILPLVEYDVTTTKLPIGLVFEVVLGDQLGNYPFQHRFLNAGTEGWFTKDAKKTSARFVNENGQEVGREVRLGATGVPHATEANIYVGEGKATPTTPQTAVAYYQYEANATKGDVIYYKKTTPVSFANLAAAFGI